MDIKSLKNYLNNNQDKIQFILEELGFHHIKYHKGNPDDYLTFGNPQGDNTSAVSLYLNESLLVINYTRQICNSKENCDFIDLVKYFRDQEEPDNNFFLTLKWISEKAGLSYYHDFEKEEFQSLKVLKMLQGMLKKIDNKDDDDIPLKPKDEIILSYYFPWVNDMFLEDGISYSTQRTFEIGYDCNTNRITIPVRDEVKTLVGVKGRYGSREVPEGIEKYYYLESCSRGKILYGYYLTKKYIDENDIILVFEAEKSVLQCWSYGIRNVVATGGTKLGSNQIDKLTRLNKKVILCFDSDFTKDDIQKLRNRFLGYVDFSAIIDKNNLLKKKESPSDRKEVLEMLLKNNVYQFDVVEDDKIKSRIDNR